MRMARVVAHHDLRRAVEFGELNVRPGEPLDAAHVLLDGLFSHLRACHLLHCCFSHTADIDHQLPVLFLACIPGTCRAR